MLRLHVCWCGCRSLTLKGHRACARRGPGSKTTCRRYERGFDAQLEGRASRQTYWRSVRATMAPMYISTRLAKSQRSRRSPALSRSGLPKAAGGFANNRAFSEAVGRRHRPTSVDNRRKASRSALATLSAAPDAISYCRGVRIAGALPLFPTLRRLAVLSSLLRVNGPTTVLQRPAAIEDRRDHPHTAVLIQWLSLPVVSCLQRSYSRQNERNHSARGQRIGLQIGLDGCRALQPRRPTL